MQLTKSNLPDGRTLYEEAAEIRSQVGVLKRTYTGKINVEITGGTRGGIVEMRFLNF